MYWTLSLHTILLSRLTFYILFFLVNGLVYRSPNVHTGSLRDMKEGNETLNYFVNNFSLIITWYLFLITGHILYQNYLVPPLYLYDHRVYLSISQNSMHYRIFETLTQGLTVCCWPHLPSPLPAGISSLRRWGLPSAGGAAGRGTPSHSGSGELSDFDRP